MITSILSFLSISQEDIKPNSQKTVLMLGFFDPPTIGHENMMKSVVRQSPDIDQFIILTNKGNNEKSPIANVEQRIKMMRIIAEQCIPQGINVVIAEATPAYSYENIKNIVNGTVHIVAGQDSLENWVGHHSEDKLSSYDTVYVVKRDQRESIVKHSNIEWIENSGVESFCSSTNVRRSLRNSPEEKPFFISPCIYSFIVDENIIY